MKILLALVLLCALVGVASAAEWLVIDIDDSSSISGYQYRLDLTYFDGCGSDFEDIAFFENTDINPNQYYFWIESYVPSTSAVIWIKVDQVSPTSIKMSYDNNFGAPSSNNGDQVFPLFDTFDAPIDEDKWTIMSGTAPDIADSIMTLSGLYSGINSTEEFGAEYAIRSSIKSYMNPSSDFEFWLAWQDTQNPVQEGCFIPDYSAYTTYNGKDYAYSYYECQYQTNNYANPNNVWYIRDVIRNSIINTQFKLDGTLKIAHSTYVSDKTESVWVYTGVAGATANVDWILARNYQSPEPVMSYTIPEPTPTPTPTPTTTILPAADFTMEVQNATTGAGVFVPIDGAHTVFRGDTVRFTPDSPVTNPRWSFGDGYKSTDQIAEHKYEFGKTPIVMNHGYKYLHVVLGSDGGNTGTDIRFSTPMAPIITQVATIATMNESLSEAYIAALGGNRTTPAGWAGFDWLGGLRATEDVYASTMGEALFLVIIFAVPFIMNWIITKDFVVAGVLGGFLGIFIIARLPAQMQLIAVAFIAMSVAAVIYSLLKEKT